MEFGVRGRVVVATLAALLAIPFVPVSPVLAGDTPSTTTLAVDITTTAYPGAATLTATVSPADATGQVEFEVDGGAAPGITIASAEATLTLTSLDAGPHSVVATYDGDTTYAASIASPNPLEFTIDKATQATLSITGPSSATYGAGNQTITTSGGSGTGDVTFDAGSSTACSIVGGKLHVGAGTGTCSVTATKAADANYTSATSDPFDIAINKATQATLSITGPSSATYGATDATITTSGGSGTGATTFDAGASTACSIASGKLHVGAGTGSCSITATKAADANYTSATSAPFDIAINKATQTITFGQLPDRTLDESPFTVAATASSGLTVTFSSLTTSVCTVAETSVALVTTGDCTIRASQGGDTNYLAAAPVQQTFTVGGGSSTTTLSSNHNPSVFGQSVTFSATVSGLGVTPTGTVTFRDGATILGTGTLNGSGVATYSTSALSVATHSITASYGGNANYTASTSSALSQSVGKAATTLGLASSDASSTYGQSVTVTATVSVAAPGAGAASGTVQFGVDGINLGAPVALAAGRASVTTSALAVGPHEVTAAYSGDGNLTGSSTTLAGGQVVTTATLTVTANPATREYGQLHPAFTASISGFVNGETLETSGVGGTPACSSAATESSPVAGSPYPITCAVGTLVAANYGFSYVAGSLTVVPAPSTITLVSDHNPAVPNQPATLTATVTGLVTGLPTPGGSVQFQAWNGATWTQLDSQTLTTGFSASTTLTLPAADGEYQYRAVFTSPDGNYSNGTGELVQSVGRSPVTVSIAGSRSTWETKVPIVFTATITPDATNATVAITGSVDFTVDGGAVQTVAVTNGAAALPARTFTAAGVAHTITAAYRPDTPGSLSYLGATATPLTKTVVANTVSATGVGTSYSSIYPYRDSWRDTVSIRGTRTEPLSVVITIYSPTGSKVRTKTYTRAAGAYAYTWNGRTTSGSMLASGRYKVVQTLADAYGARKSYTAYVTLSRKRMYWYTKTIYASPGPRNYQMRSTSNTDPAKGPALSSPSTTSTTPLVMTNSAATPAWIAAGYQFTLPSASTYTSVSFQVRHSVTWTGTTAPSIGLIPWNGGDWGSIYWGSSGTKSRARTAMGTSTTTYYAQTLTNLTSIRSGRYVRAAIDSYTAPGGYSTGPFRYSFAAVKVIVKYGILK